MPDVRDDAGYLEAIPGVVAEYCAPIVAGGRVVGALNVESRAGCRPSVRDEVDGFAEVLGRRLERLPVEQVVPMRRLGRTVGTLFDRRDPRAHRGRGRGRACELAGTDSGAVVVGRCRHARVATATGPLAAALGSIGTAELAQLTELLEPLTSCYSSGEATGLAFTGGESLRRAGACAVVAVPLGAGDRRTGVLLLAHTGPLALGPDVIEPVELLAAVAGSCLENAEHVTAVERRARLDPLTGLANHATFHESLRAAAPAGGFAVAMFDVDRFKQVNDTRGHLFGDHLLAATADAMAACLPATAASSGSGATSSPPCSRRCPVPVVATRRWRRPVSWWSPPAPCCGPTAPASRPAWPGGVRTRSPSTPSGAPTRRSTWPRAPAAASVGPARPTAPRCSPGSDAHPPVGLLLHTGG